MQSSSQTLVEGEAPVELTIELDRTYKDLKYLYLAGAEGLVDRETALNHGWITVGTGDEQLYLLRVPIPAGEKKRTVRLWVAKDEVYQGNSTYELKVYSYENEVVLPKTSLAIKYQDTTPKPVFGIFKNRELDVARTVKKGGLDYLNRFFLTVFADRSFTQPQKITLTFSGTAEEGVHYEKEAQVVLNPIYPARPWQSNNVLVLQIVPTANFDPEKTIQIKLSAAEDGVIANGETYNWPVTGEAFTLENTFTLTVTE
ncbi:hypothetical protein A3841_12350 [Pontibacter flavimaris]|uniref:Uncharacterized protein n=2 Tax=Pontibacter flavimaris TaxID=1797110 RepID=A0A1Q5PEJ5_9BACT|nr:hypothetical protein A3841_12350 [Pontibacter flavimaris]